MTEMTREEAVKGLKSLVEVRRKYGYMQIMKDEIECLNMAIEALEQEPCDAISRQAALSIVKDMHGLARADVLFTALTQLKALSSVYPKAKEPKWIPVSERLPEDGRYLCDYGDCIDFGQIHNGKWFVDGVIAWMPLPEPYKAEREDK